MIKCQQCGTLYTESATVCLYCKVPLGSADTFDSNYFNYKIKEFSNEVDAQNYRVFLITKEVDCAIKKEDHLFAVYIPEKLKLFVFRTQAENPLLNLSDNKVSFKKSSRVTISVIFGILFLIISFLFYHSKLGQRVFYHTDTSEIILVPEEAGEGSFVDPNIIEKRGVLNPNKKKSHSKKENEKGKEGHP